MTEAVQITKDMTIGDVVAKFPQVSEVFMSYGLHCVGCHVSGIESIEDGAAGHGMSDSEIDKMVAEANDIVINGPKVAENMDHLPLVTLTQAAADKVRDLAKKDGKDGQSLKVFVLPGGCSGFKYGMDFIEAPEKDDIFIEQHGLKVYVEKDSVQFVRGSLIDFIDTLNESGFKIDNPNATKSCGCGTSFS